MVDSGREVDFRRLEWVIGREVDVKEEDTSRVWALPLVFLSEHPSLFSFAFQSSSTYRSHYCCLPMKLFFPLAGDRALMK